MSKKLSAPDILQNWIDAAEVFCEARRPNYGRLTRITARAYWEYAERSPAQSKYYATVIEAQQAMAEHLTSATPYSGRDALDRALLGSADFVEEASACVEQLTFWSAREGVMPSDATNGLVARISQTISRRRRQLQQTSALHP